MGRTAHDRPRQFYYNEIRNYRERVKYTLFYGNRAEYKKRKFVL